MTAATAISQRAFEFERDTFDYPHELVWKYHFDTTGAMTVQKANPPPTYYHRCFVVVRATRQFFYHARFDPDTPPVDAQTYQRIIHEIVGRNVRRPCAEEQRVAIPGFNDLRAFSRAHNHYSKPDAAQRGNLISSAAIGA